MCVNVGHMLFSVDHEAESTCSFEEARINKYTVKLLLSFCGSLAALPSTACICLFILVVVSQFFVQQMFWICEEPYQGKLVEAVGQTVAIVKLLF